VADWNELIRDWNRYAATQTLRNVGRPLAASDAQCAIVLRLQGWQFAARHRR
jgi:hypothetical protein